MLSDYITWWDETGPHNLGILVFVLLHAISDPKVPQVALTDEKCLAYLLNHGDDSEYTWEMYPYRSGWLEYKKKHNIKYDSNLRPERFSGGSRSRSPSGTRSVSDTDDAHLSPPANPQLIRSAREACLKRKLQSESEMQKKKRKVEKSMNNSDAEQ